MTAANKEIAKIFYEIADLLQMQEVEFKPQAYQKAAELRPGDALYDHKIGSMFLSKGDVLGS